MWLHRALTENRPAHAGDHRGGLQNASSPMTEAMPVIDDDETCKENLVREILNQIDYHAAWRRGHVDIAQTEIAEELRQLSARTLLAWYEAFLLNRSEAMLAGHELNGVKILDRPADTLRTLMENDPHFDIHQYIF